MARGIAMDAIDRMPLERYLTVLESAARRQRERKRCEPEAAGGRNVVELRRGTIDDFFGRR